MVVIVETFQLGNKVAIAFPKKFGIKPGQKFEITKLKDKIILTLVD